MKISKTFLLILIVFGIIFGLFISANATVVKNVEFNVNGVLPSSESDIGFFNNSSSTESSLFSVSGGLLLQRTYSSNGNSSYHSPGVSITGTLDPSLNLVMEANLKISNIMGTGGAYFQAFDGTNRYQLAFDSLGVNLYGTQGYVHTSVDVSQFHTYRFESAANSNSYSLYIDGIFQNSTVADVHSLNKFEWGDGITASGNGADADWNYVRVSQTPVVPEPISSTLFIVGGVTLGFRRFRKKIKNI